jgi:hypothetical protein
MCYNCGCRIPNDPMGKREVYEGGGSLTDQTFKHMAKVWGMSDEEAKKNTLELLREELEKGK